MNDHAATRRFRQVDVFSEVPLAGNPLAVVVDSDGVSSEQMQKFANWTNLSETTFLLPPTDPAADYRVRIFTPTSELPFAGHPTLGSCRVWLDTVGAGSVPDRPIIQECGAGLISIRSDGERLAFAAPPLIRSGPADAEMRDRLTRGLSLDAADVVDVRWIDNGPGWVGLQLVSPDAVARAVPVDDVLIDLDVGIFALADSGDFDVDVRAFFKPVGGYAEDPVTGSLNASVAQWILGEGLLEGSYIARQGTQLGRDGRVFVDQADGEIWIGGHVATVVSGSVVV